MIKKEVVKAVYKRTKGYCECGCGIKFSMSGEYAPGFGPELHHIYWKSQYHKDDRDDFWNISLLYGPHHKNIHNGTNRGLDKRLKAEADIRKPPAERSKTKVPKKKLIYGGTIQKYDKKVARDIRAAGIEYFKQEHDGLTPSQYAYRQQKNFIKTKKKNEKIYPRK